MRNQEKKTTGKNSVLRNFCKEPHFVSRLTISLLRRKKAIRSKTQKTQ